MAGKRHRPQKKGGRAAAWSLMVLPAFGLLALILWRTGMFDAKNIRDAEQAKPPPPSLRLFEPMTVEEKLWPIIHKTTGEILPSRETEVAARIVAKIVRVEVDDGDQVDTGQTLVKLDDQGLKAALERKRRSFEQAKSKLEKARGENAPAKIKTAEQHLTEATTQLEEARQFLERANIDSPAAGVVFKLDAKTGQIASPGEILMRIFDPASLALHAPVDAELAQAIKPGKTMNVQVPALDRVLDGQVQRIVPLGGQESGVAGLIIALKPEKGLAPGMSGVLRLETGKEKAIVIPAAAVHQAQGVPYVKTILDGKTVQTPVHAETGPEPNTVMILDGLKPGAIIQVPVTETKDDQTTP